MDELLYPGATARMREARGEYQLGRAFFEKKQWKAAARHFGQAERKSGREDVAQRFQSCRIAASGFDSGKPSDSLDNSRRFP